MVIWAFFISIRLLVRFIVLTNIFFPVNHEPVGMGICEVFTEEEEEENKEKEEKKEEEEGNG